MWLATSLWQLGFLLSTELWFYVPLDTKKVISESFPRPANLLAWYGKKTKPNPTKSTHSPIEQNALQHKINTKKLKPGLVAFYYTRSENGAGLFSKEKSKRYVREEISKEKWRKKKWGNIRCKQANDIYSIKIKMESRAHYVPSTHWALSSFN